MNDGWKVATAVAILLVLLLAVIGLFRKIYNDNPYPNGKEKKSKEKDKGQPEKAAVEPKKSGKTSDWPAVVVIVVIVAAILLGIWMLWGRTMAPVDKAPIVTSAGTTEALKPFKRETIIAPVGRTFGFEMPGRKFIADPQGHVRISTASGKNWEDGPGWPPRPPLNIASNLLDRTWYFESLEKYPVDVVITWE